MHGHRAGADAHRLGARHRKAYTTRVGDGPFPTELDDEAGERLRQAGGEFGATTGRPRRCGWLDIPVLRHAARVNGLSELALTKLDVLTGIDPLPICVAYELDGKRLDVPPSIGLGRVRPIFEEMPGWSEIYACRSLEAIPANARAYVKRIEALRGGGVADQPRRRALRDHLARRSLALSAAADISPAETSRPTGGCEEAVSGQKRPNSGGIRAQMS